MSFRSVVVAVCVFAVFVSSTRPLLAQGAPAGESELVAKLAAERDDADPALVRQIAALKTESAAKALVAQYAKFASLFLKREVLKSAKEFDGVAGAEQAMLDHVATVAASSPDPDLWRVALESLAQCPHLGRHHLGRVVESAPQDQVKEEALALHAEHAAPEDAPLYKKLLADEKLAPKLHELAYGALAKNLAVPELAKTAKESRDPALRRIALQELGARKAPNVGELAFELVKQVNVLPTYRADAAKVLVAAKGAKAADELIDVAQQQATTPEVLREAIAELLSGLGDDNLDKKLLGLVGRGKPYEQRFALLATRKLPDDKVVKKLRPLVNDKDVELRRTAIQLLGERKDAESAAPLEKLLEKSKESGDGAVLVAAISRIRGGDSKWSEKLYEFAGGADRDRRNAAIDALAANASESSKDPKAAPDSKADGKLVALLRERVAHDDWSTRFVALHAIETVRDRDSIGAVVAQMQKEDGRGLFEFADVLFRMTGQLFDTQVTSWKAWWEGAGKELPLVTAEELEKKKAERERKRLSQTTRAQFFGVKIESHDVVFVVDVSGSMAEQLVSTQLEGKPATRMEVVKRELVKCLEGLDASALFNLVTFNASVMHWKEGVVALDEKTRKEAVAYVEHLGSRGGTNLYDALELAFSDPRVDTIFLLTDGEPTSGNVVDLQFIREHVARWNQTRHVKLNCIGVGADFPLLEWLAADAGGTYVKFN
jgi:HEAT repeat protein